MKVSWGCGGIAPLIIKLGTAWRVSGDIKDQAALRPAKYPGYRVHPRTCVGFCGHKINLFPVPGLDTRIVQPLALPTSFN